VLTASTAVAAWLALIAPAQPETVELEIKGNVLRPRHVAATADRLAKLTLPDGFRIEPFAKDLGEPRIIAVDPDGAVYVTRKDTHDVARLVDADKDGFCESAVSLFKLEGLHGLAIHDGVMYLATVKEVYAAKMHGEGLVDNPVALIADLPDGGQHPRRTIGVGPDKLMYVSIGSTCNACEESNPEHAAMVRVALDGSNRTVIATGLRNTIGFAWHPETGRLWGMDHGIDYLGDDTQREELNRIEEEGFYGWPWTYEDGKENKGVQPPKHTTIEELRSRNKAPALTYTAHAAPMIMLFYTGDQFPAEYRNDAFVTMRGSWNRKPPSGYEVVRIRFSDAGEPEGMEPFITGFLQDDGKAHIGRLCGLAQMPDGSLLVGDDTGGVIYRVTYGRPTVLAE